jgi:methylenetetrahydrofolate reductase (NADPH)
MPQILDILAKAQAAHEDKSVPLFSFEFFPPKTPKGVLALYKRAWRMQKQGPLFADITWGAGGTTSELTMELSTNFLQKLGLEVNMHLTCTNIKPEGVKKALVEAKEAGIKNIVALRGDPPAGQEKWQSTEGGFECALDLVKFIKKTHQDNFGLAVAGYPEGHPNAIKKVEDLSKLSVGERRRLIKIDDDFWCCHDEDFEKEIAYLKEKVDAGGQMIITQLFFDPQVFFAFEKKCREVGITVPIFPGIMPIANRGGFKRMTGFCKTRIPYEMQVCLDAASDEDFKKLGHEMIVDLCKTLWASGKVPALHFYTLNQENSVYAIMKDLNIPVKDPETEFAAEKEKIYAEMATLVEIPPEAKKAKTS